ncbi:MAG: Zn-ribbon containing protein [Candidatus Altiarchaeota archaeon]|nr:Zn-ribbon containing protein [Candidatus Altiarchaeota archaeon]
MPHKCTRCSRIYDDKAEELVTSGCECGSRVFLYLRPDYAGTKEKTVEFLKEHELPRQDLEWLDREFNRKLEVENTIITLDVENVTRIGEGKFELNLKSLMSGEPIVIKAKDGVYYIDIEYAMKPKRKR